MEVSKVIQNVLYTAQFKGISYANKIKDLCREEKTGVIRQLDLAEILFNDVLVSPKMGIDDFSDSNTFDEVFGFLIDVATGDFNNQKTTAQLKQQARAQMACWRLIFSDISNLDYNTVFNQMTPQEIEEANLALDMIIAEIKRKSNS